MRDYIEVIIKQKILFKKSIRRKKSYVINFPGYRCLGKTTLILKLAKRYNLQIITKYEFYQKPYIHKNSYVLDRLPRSNKKIIYLIDGLDLETICKLKNLGYVVIGYIN